MVERLLQAGPGPDRANSTSPLNTMRDLPLLPLKRKGGRFGSIAARLTRSNVLFPIDVPSDPGAQCLCNRIRPFHFQQMPAVLDNVSFDPTIPSAIIRAAETAVWASSLPTSTSVGQWIAPNDGRKSGLGHTDTLKVALGTPMGAGRTGLHKKLNRSPPCRNGNWKIASGARRPQPNQRKCRRYGFTRK